MSIVKTIWRELVGLFVDDGSFALAIIAWLIGGAILIRFGLDPTLDGGLLFAGFAALLAENVRRTTKAAAKSKRGDSR